MPLSIGCVRGESSLARHVYDKFKEVMKGGGRQFGKRAAMEAEKVWNGESSFILKDGGWISVSADMSPSDVAAFQKAWVGGGNSLDNDGFSDDICVRGESSLARTGMGDSARVVIAAGGGGGGAGGAWEAPPRPAEWDEKNAARYRGAECGACGRDEVEEVYQEQDDDGYERVVKMVCSSCSHERLDVFRFHHYE